MNKIDERQFFPHELKATFVLRRSKAKKPQLVYMLVRLDKQYKFTLNVKVYPNQYNSELQQAYISNILKPIDNANNKIVNDKINEYKKRFDDFVSYLCETETKDNLIKILRDFIYKDINMKKNTTNKSNDPISLLKNVIYNDQMTESSKGQYIQKINRLEDYCNANNIHLSDINEINLDFLYQFRNWYKMQPSKSRALKKGDKVTLKVVNDTVSKIITTLDKLDDTIYNHVEAKLFRYKPFRVQNNTEDNEIALTEDEVIRIFNLELEGKEAKVRDAFIFQCFTSQRYNDIKNFKERFQLINTDEGEMWVVNQQKGKKLVQISITKIAKFILDRNNSNIEYGDNHITNDILRGIAEKAGMNEEHIYVKNTADGMQTYKRKRWECMSTHVARRTLVTIARQNEIDDKLTMSATGHTSVSMIDRYDKGNKTKQSKKFGEQVDNILSLNNEGKLEANNNNSINNIDKTNNSNVQNIMYNMTELLEKAKEEGQNNALKKQIDEDKQALALLGAAAIEIADANTIDTIQQLICKYQQPFINLGVDPYFIKALFHNSEYTTMTEKRNQLEKIIEELKQ